MPHDNITVSGSNTQAVLVANRRQLFLDDHVDSLHMCSCVSTMVASRMKCVRSVAMDISV